MKILDLKWNSQKEKYYIYKEKKLENAINEKILFEITIPNNRQKIQPQLT